MNTTPTPAQKAAATRRARRAAPPVAPAILPPLSLPPLDPAAEHYAVGPLPLPAAREDRPMLPTAGAIYNHVRPGMGAARREMFRVLCLDPRNRLLADVVIGIGSVDSVQVDPREVFAPAIVAKATSIVLVHNHPSGDPTPSPQDIQLTQQLARGAELLGMRISDHVVVSESRYASLAPQIGNLRGYGY